MFPFKKCTESCNALTLKSCLLSLCCDLGTTVLSGAETLCKVHLNWAVADGKNTFHFSLHCDGRMTSSCPFQSVVQSNSKFHVCLFEWFLCLGHISTNYSVRLVKDIWLYFMSHSIRVVTLPGLAHTNTGRQHHDTASKILVAACSTSGCTESC